MSFNEDRRPCPCRSRLSLFSDATSAKLQFDSRINAGDLVSNSGIDGATETGFENILADVDELAAATER